MIPRDIKILDVIFKDGRAVFGAGETVSGHVVLELGEEVKIKGIKVEMVGMARVHWDETRSYTKGTPTKLSHKNTEVYLNETCSIINRVGTLAAGRHSWPFTVSLPKCTPASYDGQWGRVLYYARAVVERRWKGAIEQSRTFIVQGHLDLNSEPDSRNGVEVHGDVLVGPMCCRSGHLEGQLLVRRCGFVPGESLHFTAKVENCSHLKASTRVSLVQVAIFRADNKVKKTTIALRTVTTDDVEARHSQAWEGVIEPIPMAPPTKLGRGCKLIEVKYQLVLYSVTSGFGQDLCVPMDIILGTVPLRKNRSPYNSRFS